MTLRLKINLIVLALSALFLGTLVWQEIDATRRSVQEEMLASNRVTTQLLRRLSVIYEQAGARAMQLFLSELGRVRANEITLVNAEGRELYRSRQERNNAAAKARGQSKDDYMGECIVSMGGTTTTAP